MPVSQSTHKKFPLPGLNATDKRLADMQAVKSALVAIDASLVTSITANFPGAVAPIIGTPRYYPNKSVSIGSICSWLSEAPTTEIVLAVRKNSVVVASITIPLAQSKVTTSCSPAIALTTADYLTIDVVSGAGKDLVVRLDY